MADGALEKAGKKLFPEQQITFERAPEDVIPESALEFARQKLGIKKMEPAKYEPLEAGPAFPESVPRILSSFAKNPDEKLGYFNREFGGDKGKYEFTKAGDQVFWRKKGAEFYHPVDPSGWGEGSVGDKAKEVMSDIADVTPEMIEMGASGGGAALAGPPGAAMGGSTGNLINQMAGNLLGVNDTSPRKDETPSQYMSRMSPNMMEALGAGVASGLGELGGGLISRGLKRAIPDASLPIPGRFPEIVTPNTLRPIPPSEGLGKIGLGGLGEGIESFNRAIGSPYATGLRREQEGLAKKLVQSGEKVLKPDVEIPGVLGDLGEAPKTFAQLKKALPASLKEDESTIKQYFRDGYSELADSISGAPLDKSAILGSLDKFSPVNDEAKKALGILKTKINGIKDLSELLKFKQSDTYKTLLQSSKASVSKDMGGINNIIDEGLRQNISNIPDVGAGLADDLADLNKQYANFKDTAKSLSTLKKNPDFLNATTPEKKMMQKLILNNLPSSVEYPSGFTQNIYERALAAGIPEKVMSGNNLDMSALDKLMKNPKVFDYLKELTSKPNTQIGSGKVGFGDILDMLKQTSAGYTPPSTTPSTLNLLNVKDWGNLAANAVNLPLSQAAYNPLGTAGRLATNQSGLKDYMTELLNGSNSKPKPDLKGLPTK